MKRLIQHLVNVNERVEDEREPDQQHGECEVFEEHGLFGMLIGRAPRVQVLSGSTQPSYASYSRWVAEEFGAQ